MLGPEGSLAWGPFNLGRLPAHFCRSTLNKVCLDYLLAVSFGLEKGLGVHCQNIPKVPPARRSKHGEAQDQLSQLGHTRSQGTSLNSFMSEKLECIPALQIKDRRQRRRQSWKVPCSSN